MTASDASSGTMAQLTAHRNRNRRTAKVYPYLVDVQSDAVSRLPTCVVVPVMRTVSLPYSRIQRLMPTVEICGESHTLVVQELAAMVRVELGDPVADLSAHRAEVIAALDLLLTGA